MNRDNFGLALYIAFLAGTLWIIYREQQSNSRHRAELERLARRSWWQRFRGVS